MAKIPENTLPIRDVLDTDYVRVVGTDGKSYRVPKSGFGASEEELAEKADIITSSASGSIAHFTDGAAYPAESVVAHIEPLQDLHGYEYPWAGGAGKNKVPKGTNRTSNGITYTVQENGEVVVTGTATATSFWGVQFSIPAGTYILNGCPQGGGNSTYVLDVRNAVGGSGISGINGDSGNGSTFTISEALTAYLNIRIASGYSAPSGGLKFSPMIRLASVTDAAYAPYSNICPISGWTGCNVYVSPTTTAGDGTTYHITFPSSAGTVYGGYVDAVNGKLVVDRAMVDLGTLNWSRQNTSGHERIQNTEMTGIIKGSVNNATKANILCSIYATITANGSYNHDEGIGIAVSQTSAIFVYDNNYTDAASFKAAMNGVQLAYELATPIEYDLTPTQIDILLGTNNVWNDGNGNTDVQYSADTKLFILNAIANALNA